MKGIIIPMYFGMTSSPIHSSIANLISLKNSHSNVPIIVIINISNGPGSSFNNNVFNNINTIRDSGIKVIGYVYTTTNSRTVSQINAQTDLWYDFYPQIDGIFFDEYYSSVIGQSGYMSICQYARNKGADIIVGNPGGRVSSSFLNTYAGSPNFFIVYEFFDFPPISEVAWFSADPSKRGIFPHSIQSSNVSDSAFNTMMEYIDWIYCQDDTLPNPWNTISSWIERQIQLLSPYNVISQNEAIRIKVNGLTKNLKNDYSINENNAMRIKYSSHSVGLTLQEVSDDDFGANRIHTSSGTNSIN